MALATRLSLTFAKSNGDSMNISYNHAKPNASAANVKSLMEGIIASADIFEHTPATIRSAKIITTETTEIDLS